ncbi:threonine-phosphate decarboxylase [Thioclava sp. FR2]|uniref:threonine-phosphate decarboxylase n=1 Tax=Thioclava sp. FR2 TaxID=3445780 RepID=UPI003EB8DF7D
MHGDEKPDHGGGVDAAVAKWGGQRDAWIDLSTGINPLPYPVTDLPFRAWTTLPDQAAQEALIAAARQFWSVPQQAAVLAAPGASALIARIPALRAPSQVQIAQPTYNEHGRAFATAGWIISDQSSDTIVAVHPNNPDGRVLSVNGDFPKAEMVVIDESFCDIIPQYTMIEHAVKPGVIILKSFGKFWGLAGLRLGFAIGDPRLLARLEQMMGPWPVSGPALAVGTAALLDQDWATATRQRLAQDADRLDHLMIRAGASLVGGTPLFRLYDTDNAKSWQDRLAKRHIWSRIFPYSDRWLRLGIPGVPAEWDRLEAALG